MAVAVKGFRMARKEETDMDGEDGRALDCSLDRAAWRLFKALCRAGCEEELRIRCAALGVDFG